MMFSALNLRPWIVSVLLHAGIVACVFLSLCHFKIRSVKPEANLEIQFSMPARQTASAGKTTPERSSTLPREAKPVAHAQPASSNKPEPTKRTHSSTSFASSAAISPGGRSAPQAHGGTGSSSSLQGDSIKPEADKGWLTHTLWSLMDARKRYPLQAKRLGLEGKVVVEAVIGGHGELVSARIRQSAGPILDQDALALLKSVTPLRVERYRIAANTALLIPITYSLN